MRALRVFSSMVQSPADGMALDEFLLTHTIQNASQVATLRFYEFTKKCITIGLSQRNSEFLKMIDGMGFEWVRRPTGGGMVIHEADLIFSLIASLDAHPSFSQAKDSYRAIHEAIKKALLALGTETSFNQGGCKVEALDPQLMICFERPICDDLMHGKRKLVGGAQRRSAGFFLHQGAIRLSEFKQTDKIRLQSLIIQAFSDSFNWSAVATSFSESDLKIACQLSKEKYSSLDWN